MPRLAVIYYGGFLSKAGGAFSHVSALRQGLETRGWNVRVITLDDLPLWSRFLPHLIEKTLNAFDRPMGFWWKGEVTRWLYRRRFDLPADLRVFEDIYLGWDSHTPSITILHAVWSDNLQAYDIRADKAARLRAREASRIDAIGHPVATVSAPYARFLERDHYDGALRRRLDVIELGVDPPAAPDIPRQTKSLVYVGTLEPRKNVAFLLDVFAMIREHDPAFQLTLVGDGPDRKRLEARAKELHVPVTFTGRLSRERTFLELSRHDIYVHPSKKESFSFALLEAKLAGLTTCAYGKLEVPAEFIDHPIDGFDRAEWCRTILGLDRKVTPFPKDKFTISRMTQATLELSLKEP